MPLEPLPDPGAVARTAPRVGDRAPLDVRAPTIVVCCPTHWDPSRAELVDTYDRLIANVPDRSGIQMVGIAGDGPWRELAFGDAPSGDAAFGDAPFGVAWHADTALGERFGVGDRVAVFVLDENGIVRWRHVDGLDAPPRADELASALASSEAGTGWTRRAFVAAALAASAAHLLLPRTARAGAPGAPSPAPSVPGEAPGTMSVTLHVNGRDVPLELEPRVTLLDALRERTGLTGSKKGCDHGQCGACTVHVDGRRVLSCLTLAVMAQGKAITTIEGLAETTPGAADGLHPMQRAFIAHDGFQCGYCTPGQIMSAAAVLHEPWGAADADAREAMSGNLCRCGAYPGILAAVQSVRRAAADGTEHRE